MIAWVYKLIQSYRQDTARNAAPEPLADQLLSCAYEGRADDLLHLLHSGCDVNSTDAQGSSALHLTVKASHEQCVEALLRHPLVCLSVRDKWGRTPVHCAVVWRRLEILKSLAEFGPDTLNIVDYDGKTPLHVACASGAIEHVQFLLMQKVRINALDHRKWTPLMCAVAVQNEAVVQMLLNFGADCNEPLFHNSGDRALKVAIEKHSVSIVQTLLERGALVEFSVIVSLGSFQQTGHRQTLVCCNLASAALEQVNLSYPQSINIALKVLRASPVAPDEDAIFKLYEQYGRPSPRLQRSVSRELLHIADPISELAVQNIFSIINLSLAVGIDLSPGNIERLRRKFRLDEKRDVQLFGLIKEHRSKSLKLLASLALRRALIDLGHKNILAAVKHTNLPHFVHDLLLLYRW